MQTNKKIRLVPDIEPFKNSRYAVAFFPPQCDYLFPLEEIIEGADCHFLVDGGANHYFDHFQSFDERCIFLGDSDSITEPVLKALNKSKCQQFHYPQDKDATDGAIALNYLSNFNYESLWVLGGLSISRVDHFLMNLLSALSVQKNSKLKRIIFTDGKIFIDYLNSHQNYYYFPSFFVKQKMPLRFSIIALEPIKNLTLKGLRWPEDKKSFDLDFFSSRGLSNEYLFEEEKVEVYFDKGKAVVILNAWD